MDVKIMRTNRKRNNHIGGFIFEVKKHALTFLMFILLFSGLLIGNFTISGNKNIFESVDLLFKAYIDSLDGQTFITFFIREAIISIGIVILNLSLGLCAVGFPISLITILIKGISIGALSTYMYTVFALKGFGYCMLVIYPVQIFSCLILLKVCHESITMSVSVLKILTEKKMTASDKTDIRRYLIRFMILIIFSLLLSGISSVMSLYITRLFGF